MNSGVKSKIAALLLLAVSASACLQLAGKSLKLASRLDKPNYADVHSLRLAPLRQYIKPGMSVGYKDEEDDYSQRFFLTQYAFIPALVRRGTDFEMVIAGFRSREASQALAKSENMRIMAELDGGLLLLERQKK